MLTLLGVDDSASAEAERARFLGLQTEVRALVVEMNNVLEKATQLAAREARRRSRSVAKQLDGDAEPTPQLVVQDSEYAPSDPLERAEWKRRMRTRRQGAHG